MRLSKILLSLVVLMTVAAGCGGSSPEEALVEEILERSGDGVGDVDISNDGDDFDMTITGEDGETISVSGSGDEDDFSMVIEGEGGDVMTFGGGEIPEGLVTPIPDGGSVVSSMQLEGDLSVSVEYDKSRFDELVATFDSLMGGDDVNRFESSSSTDDGTIRSVSWTAGDGNQWVSVSDCYSMSSGELDAVCLNVAEYGD